MPAIIGETFSATLGAGAATQLAGQNNNRIYCLITNNDSTENGGGNNMMYVAFGGVQATTGHIPIPPGGSLEVAVGKGQMQGEVWAIAGSGTPKCSYTEA